MRILYIDIDSQRPDHFGCYGYHRNTSPNIDAIAAAGVRFDHCHASDVPCLPSRTSLFSGRFGIHTGVVNHGGAQAEMFNEGITRGFRSHLGRTNWMTCLRNAGLRTVTVSPFGERHSAFHWYAGFNEIYNTGRGGMESAEHMYPAADDWIKRNGASDDWFLHVNFWDPHTPYRAPDDYGDPFKDEPLPAWLTEEVRQRHWEGVGPHSAREIPGYDSNPGKHRRQPVEADSMDKVRMMFDGYDTGVKYADDHIGRLLNRLADLGVLDDTAVIISADHGENLGELNVYGDHQLADQITTRVPLIIKWPGVTDNQQGRVDDTLLYANDWAATAIELAGGSVPQNWDGRSFADSFKDGNESGREYMVLSQNAWSCQRSVRFRDGGKEYICIRSYHDGYHGFPDVMLFDLTDDPHEQHDIAPDNPNLVGKAMTMLDDWMGKMMRTATTPHDPLWTVMSEGGSFHTRGQLPGYARRLRDTDRAQWAEHLEAKHPRDL